MLKKFKDSTHYSSSDESIEQQRTFANGSDVNSNQSPKELSKGLKKNGSTNVTNQIKFTKPNNDNGEHNLLDLRTHLDSSLNDHYHLNLHNQLPMGNGENSNIFNFLEHADRTNEDTDSDSVQILEQPDGRESVEVLYENSDSDSVSLEEELIFDNDKTNTDSTTRNLVELNSSSDSSSGDLINNEFNNDSNNQLNSSTNLNLSFNDPLGQSSSSISGR